MRVTGKTEATAIQEINLPIIILQNQMLREIDPPYVR